MEWNVKVVIEEPRYRIMDLRLSQYDELQS